MIEISKSPTADTRTCDYSTVTKDQLLVSSEQHIRDVRAAIAFFIDKLALAAEHHDQDKITGIAQFYADFITGFKTTDWWDNHRKISRHHLLSEDGIPEDVDLFDILEMVADCVMAGMARSGNVYPLDLPPMVLVRALRNTTEKLKEEITINFEATP